jgi:putative pyruvate formate lyase activating enzyme
MDKREKLSKLETALSRLSSHTRECRLCPRRCAVNRSAGETGFCGLNDNRAQVSHALLHFGEEPVLSGMSDCRQEDKPAAGSRRGSGTVFFSGCNLRCLYCQNYQISWQRAGQPISDGDLAGMFLDLQARGAANINLVSPTPHLLPILRALGDAISQGLDLPVVYNSHGYDSSDILREVEGIFDIYLPDFKYYSSALSNSLSSAPGYFETAAAAVTEMYCQQPKLEIDEETGFARRGLIVRHLVLPGFTDDSGQILEWLAQHLSPYIGLSLMSQYTPCYLAPPGMRRRLRPQEYRQVRKYAEALGFAHQFLQPEPFVQGEHLTPDFSKKSNPFTWRKIP